MLHRRTAFALALAAIAAATPAQACRMFRPLEPAYIRNADIVVVGRISGYRVDAGRYATFTLTVGEVLRGRPARQLLVRWDNSTFALPAALPPGPHLVALRNPGAAFTPRGAFPVLQVACSSPFILPVGSPEAAAARRALGRR